MARPNQAQGVGNANKGRNRNKRNDNKVGRKGGGSKGGGRNKGLSFEEKLSRRTTLASRQRLLKKKGRRDPDLDDPNYFTRPQTLGQANIEADRLANLRYGGVESDIRQQQANVQPWFDQYRQQVQASAQQSQAAYQPVIDQAQQRAQQAGQQAPQATAPGVDPNSQATQDAALAAASRQALGNTLVTALQGTNAADQSYFASRSGPVAGAAQLGLNVDLAREYGDVKRERGDYRAGVLADTRENERRYGLEQKAFGLDVAEANVDAADKAADNRRAQRENRQARRDKRYERKASRRAARADTRKDRADYIARYGIEPEKVEDGLTAAERKQMQDFKKSTSGSSGGSSGGLTPAQQRAAKKERGEAINRVGEVGSLWDEYKRGKIQVEGPPGADGKPTTKTRPPTPDEIKARLRKEGYNPNEIHIALMIRAGKALTPKDKATARRMGIYPIPKKWKQGKPKPGIDRPAGTSRPEGGYGGPT